jgi:hypothetical protein
MPTINEVLLSRFRADGVPALEPAKIALVRTFAFQDEVRAERVKVEGNKNLSPIGRRDAMQKFVAEKAHELHRARKTVDTMRAKLDERRAKLAPTAPDVTGTIKRGEMRTMLRGMNIGQRMKLLTSLNPDPTWIQAVLEMPNEMSGIDPQTRELVMSAVVERAHPGALARIEQAEEAIVVVNAAVEVTFNTVRDAAEFPNNAVLSDFVTQSIGATAQLDAEISRGFEALAEIAA